MTQYIDKAAVIAKIEKLQDSTMDEDSNFYTAKAQAEYNVLCMLESFLDTLEVKEVDLEKELDYKDYMNFFKEHPDFSNRDWGFDECWIFAEYFYKLGIKAQRGE